MGRTAWMVCITLVLVFVASSADAQRRRRRRRRPRRPPAVQVDPAQETARAAYARGQQLFGAGDFSGAEAAFTEAAGAVPNPPAQVIIAIAESRERGGNVPGAVETLETYLAAHAESPQRAQLETRISALKETPATLVLSSEPPGASISIDGESHGGVTPAEVQVPPGEHAVVLTLEGHEPGSETVQAGYGARHEVTLSLESAPVLSEDDVFGDDSDPVEEDPYIPSEPDQSVEDSGPGGAVWIATGITLTGMVAGSVLGFMALSEQSDFDETPTADTADSGERFALFADVAFGVAAAAGITAIVLYLSSGGDDDEPEDSAGLDVTLVPQIARHGGGLRLGVEL